MPWFDCRGNISINPGFSAVTSDQLPFLDKSLFCMLFPEKQ